jgi:predicted ATP-dependent endonuclease of OLD family
MRIFNLKIKNYRLLRDFSMDLEKELSLVIGKNNTGKTSILTILDKFLNQPDRQKFAFDDFNIDFKKELKALMENDADVSESEFEKHCGLGIKLRLLIRYEEADNLGNINCLMMDLDPANNVVVLGFDYALDLNDYIKLKRAYALFKNEEETKNAADASHTIRGVYDFLKVNHANYFKVGKKTIKFDPVQNAEDESDFIDLVKEKLDIKEIINFKCISAKRGVTNSDSDKTLSAQTSRIYQKTEISDGQSKVVEEFKDRLSDADVRLSAVYQGLFSDVIKKVKDFGGIKISDSEIEIISTLQHQRLLEGNTTVVYKHDADSRLPEHYNGLGYMNLISMIFEIEVLLQDFKKEKESRPADINLLFIEEPEAHTHPQMQYVFIKNIKKLIREGIKRDDGENRAIQYIISTHSSCIVADSDFDDIKYLKKEGNGGVKAKNLSALQAEYAANPTSYKFLKQYLTISRAEIFFADKAVLIEGDTERILIPTIMRKIDIEEAARHAAAGTKDSDLPLMSQNISVVEVGAYSQIFELFIDFLGIKSVIITDLDSVDAGGEACPVAAGVAYSNAAIDFFLGSPTLAQLRGYTFEDKKRAKVGGTWKKRSDGKLYIAYQVVENGYAARSFEDGFIHLNRAFVSAKKTDFRGLKNRPHFDNLANDAYFLADKCVSKKTHFALDILFHSNAQLDNWQIPAYIKESLLWVKQD